MQSNSSLAVPAAVQSTSASGDGAAKELVADTKAQGAISAVAVVYVVLWVFEGAFRKWLPGSDQIFYLARDIMLVLSLIFVAVAYPLRRERNFIFWPFVLAVGVLSAVQVIAAGLNQGVAVIGVRGYIAPLLLVYAIWRYRPNNLLNPIAWVILLVSPLELLISLAQVHSPASSFVNKQVGSEVTQFINSGGIVRASGTFSSPSGLTVFVPLCLAVSLALLPQLKGPKRLLAGSSVLTCLALAGIAGSRGAVLGVALVVAMYGLQQLALGKWASIKRVVGVGLMLIVALVALNAALPQVFDSLLQRFQDAGASEDSGARILDQVFGFTRMDFPILGNGSGADSVAGVALGSGKVWFEIESEKWTAELGIFGYILSFGRLAFVIALASKLLGNLRDVSTMALLVAAVWIPEIVYGQITQNPTVQGFFSIAATIIWLAWPTRYGDRMVSTSAPAPAPAPAQRQGSHVASAESMST